LGKGVREKGKNLRKEDIKTTGRLIIQEILPTGWRQVENYFQAVEWMNCIA
jgi:hypothetical protein